MIDAEFFIAETQSILKLLYKVSFGILGSDADAKDAVQQAMLKAWAARAQANPEKFRAWITRIVMNESRLIWRYKRRVVPVETMPEDSREEQFDFEVLDAVKSLPEKYRIPFVLKYVCGYKEREIADIMHLPASTVKSRLAKTRHMLRKALSDWEVSFE